jgi:hypothetical protein
MYINAVYSSTYIIFITHFLKSNTNYIQPQCQTPKWKQFWVRASSLAPFLNTTPLCSSIHVTDQVEPSGQLWHMTKLIYHKLTYSSNTVYVKHRALLPRLGNKEVGWTVMALWKSYLAVCKFKSRGRNVKMLFRNVRYMKRSIAAERLIKPSVNWLGVLHCNEGTCLLPSRQ